MPLLWGCYGLCAAIEAQQRGVGWVGPGVPDSGLGRGLKRLRDHAPCRYNPAPQTSVSLLRGPR